jgi:hypothetical protein
MERKNSLAMSISKEAVSRYQAATFRLQSGAQLASAEQAVEFVNQRGFVMFWPMKEIVMPSLWAAVAGNRPVADEHDDPGHVTWGWKDNLLGKGYWYYGRVLRKRNTFISLSMLPYFYALSPNYGDPNEDYLIEYEQGQLNLGAKQVYEALLRDGPLDSITLRKTARLTGNNSEFTRALEVLQTTFRVLPVGVSQAGAWHYSFIYDIVARHFPELQEQARPISEFEARRSLITCYLNSVGAAREKDVQRLFAWPLPVVQREIGKLAEQGAIRAGVQLPGEKGDWLVSPLLVEE